jgi:acyl phosphate:glycerol-3-phosphate acyltransferase
MILSSAILVLFAYLLGSIPSAVWIGKHFYNIDVREHGSGNAGATNTLRVLGKKAGIPVLIIDALKGYVAVMLASYSTYMPATTSYINFQLVLGTSALLGHIFPVFASFRGGKGIATLLGVTIAISPIASAISIVVFLLVFVSFNYVSLGSIVAALVYPLSIIIILKVTALSLIVFSILVALLVVITHKKNIQRLLKNEEPKTRLFKSKE